MRTKLTIYALGAVLTAGCGGTLPIGDAGESMDSGTPGSDAGAVGDDNLLMLMQDPYANYVVQRAFDRSGGALRQRLTDEIKRRSELLQRFTYGRHILLHINRAAGAAGAAHETGSGGGGARGTARGRGSGGGGGGARRKLKS